MSFWYCMASLCALLLAISILILPNDFAYNKFFFSDSLDTGMDFFHSIEYTRGRSPYLKFNTLYPPLANLLFYIIYKFVPNWQIVQWTDTFSSSVAARGTSVDLRVWQPTLLLFILFIICSVTCIIFIGIKYLGLNCESYLILVCIMFSHSMLWAYERGNIIILSFIGSLFYVLFYDSHSKICQELALLSLAFAAGIKIYPAIFGILLLYNRDYRKAFRLILYGVAFFILPCFAFKEGLGCIQYFLKVLISYSFNSENYINGFSADKLLNCISFALTGKNILTNDNVFISNTVINLFSAAVILILGFFKSKKWQKVLGCSLSIILMQSQSIYILVFMLIPLLMLVREERIITKQNIIYFFFLVVINLFLPAFNDGNFFSGTYIRFQICIIGLVICYFLSSCINIYFFIKEYNKGQLIMNKVGKIIWTAIEKILQFALCKLLHLNISDVQWKSLLQFVKFGIVGLSNTIISYLLYVISLLFFQKLQIFNSVDYLIAQVIAFILSVLWSFYWNNKYVFEKSENEERNLLKSLLKTYISYAFTGLFLNSILSLLWVEVFHWSKMIAPIINLLVSVPLNFIMNKFWAFKNSKK